MGYATRYMATIQALLADKNPDREYFLRAILKMDRATLFSHQNHELTPEQTKRLADFERQRAGGQPVQYIVGEAWFYGLKFHVAPGVLIPRPETELMVDRALALTCAYGAEHKKCSVIDLGTGSGAVAIAIAKNSDVPVWAVDISLKALTIARANARTHGVKIKFHKDNVRRKIAWPNTGHVIATANLPYLSDAQMKKLSHEVQCEPKLALFGGHDGLDLYRDFFAALKTYCKQRQTIVLLCEIDPEQETKLAAIAHREFPKPQILSHRDLHGDIRLIEITL